MLLGNVLTVLADYKVIVAVLFVTAV